MIIETFVLTYAVTYCTLWGGVIGASALKEWLERQDPIVMEPVDKETQRKYETDYIGGKMGDYNVTSVKAMTYGNAAHRVTVSLKKLL